MPAIVLTEREQDLLAGLPHIARCLYMALLRRRDFTTGLVGVTVGVSWQALVEDVYVEPHRGPVQRAPGREQVRRAARWLVAAGLVRMRSDVEERQLIFRLPHSYKSLLARKQSDRNPTEKPDRPTTEGNNVLTRPDAERATRQSSENRDIHRTAARSLPGVAVNYGAAAARMTWLTENQQAAVVRTATAAKLSAEDYGRLLAELEAKRREGQLRNPAQFFHSIAAQLVAGLFRGDRADRILGGGRPLSAAELQVAERLDQEPDE